MYKKVIKFEDFDGREREGTFYFNLTAPEVIKWEGMVDGTLREKIERISQTDNKQELINLFDEIIGKAYGEKSLDGMYFRKSEQILADFKATKAYASLFMELSSNDIAGAEFINGILPPELLAAIEEKRKEEAESLKVLEGGAEKE